MESPLCEIGWLQIQAAQRVEVGCAQVCKFVQQPRQRSLRITCCAALPVYRLKDLVLVTLQNQLEALHPAVAFEKSQMVDDVEWRHGAIAFVLLCPRFGQAAQQGIESRWSTFEQSDRVVKIKFHSGC